MKFDIDVGASGDLLLAYDIQPTRYFIENIKLDDDQVSSLGLWVDFALKGTTRLSQDGVTPGSTKVG